MEYYDTKSSAGSPIVQRLTDLLFARRVVALFVVLSCGTVLGIAAWLTPSESGMGTHTQMGLPPCSWITTINLPCPTCGFTTAFSNLAHGRFYDAFVAQPFGALVGFATAVFFIGGLVVLVTGAPLGGALCRFWTMKVTWVVLIMLLLGWVYTMLRFRGII
ncbi:MAG: hypothetical protein CMJ24_09145 [Phycisphaerae bacterium]|nr:hypothetical protein [Phycisphaerae bacterium]|tara:strand:+ start:2516 stop:2998 length:483 start_codon:yes stop_codon:yes gene_type:complete